MKLVLASGREFYGRSFGKTENVTGELVFTTGVIGYTNNITDPRYEGQIVMQTFPLAGNYGFVHDGTDEPHAKAYIARDFCGDPSNFRCEKTLEEYMTKKGVVGLYGIDTREVTRILRDNGTMNAAIMRADETPDLEAIRNYRVGNAAEKLSVSSISFTECENAEHTVGVIDLGTARECAEKLGKISCRTVILPYGTPAEKITSLGLDGVVISDGPGDPAECGNVIKTVKALFGSIPLLGLGLGHGILALAASCRTYKLKYGHRGSNHPVKDISTGKCEITVQNHGYAVDCSSVTPDIGRVDLVNINDRSCEGITYAAGNAFSVQYVPGDSSVFEKFVRLF